MARQGETSIWTLIGLGLTVAATVAGALLFVADGRYVRPGQVRAVAREVIRSDGCPREEAAAAREANAAAHDEIRREIAGRLGRIEATQAGMEKSLDSLRAQIDAVQLSLRQRRGGR